MDISKQLKKDIEKVWQYESYDSTAEVKISIKKEIRTYSEPTFSISCCKSMFIYNNNKILLSL